MNKRDLKMLHKQLNQQMAELLGGTDCNLEGLHQSDESLPDLMDQVALKAERDYSYERCDRNNHYVRQIEEALLAIQNNEYGICRRCEEMISIKRLKARPVARYCIDCKTELERIERQTGSPVH